MSVPVTPFTIEAARLMDARRAAKTPAEREDAEGAVTYLLQMNGAGRLDEYFAMQQEMAANAESRTRSAGER